MILPEAKRDYDRTNEQQTRHAIQQEDKFNRKTTGNVEIDNQMLILKSPNGGRWSIEVDDAGAITATAL